MKINMPNIGPVVGFPHLQVHFIVIYVAFLIPMSVRLSCVFTDLLVVIA